MKYELLSEWNDVDFGGSGIVGTFFMPRRQLVTFFGQEPIEVNGTRIKERWLIKFEDGLVAIISKLYKDEEDEWCVGGFGNFDKKTKENLHLKAVQELLHLV